MDSQKRYGQKLALYVNEMFSKCLCIYVKGIDLHHREDLRAGIVFPQLPYAGHFTYFPSQLTPISVTCKLSKLYSARPKIINFWQISQ